VLDAAGTGRRSPRQAGDGQALGGSDASAQALGPGGTGPAGPVPMGPIGTIRPIGSTGPLDAGGYGGGSALGPDDGAHGGSDGGPAAGGTH